MFKAGKLIALKDTNTQRRTRINTAADEIAVLVARKETGEDTTKLNKEIEWYLWFLAVITSMAALEIRALRSDNQYATMSSVARKHARRSQATKAATTVAISGTAAWWINHIVFAELEHK